MNPRLIIGGLKSYLPIPERKYKGTGGTSNALYSYSVWFRHLYWVAHHLGRDKARPKTVVELGPGDSIGTGIAALLSVADTYIGLDVLEHASHELNEQMLAEIASLFRSRSDLGSDTSFARTYPRLPTYAFPIDLIGGEELERRLSEANLDRIRTAMKSMAAVDNPVVQYRSPWHEGSVKPSSADYVFSQGALNDMDHIASRDDLGRNIQTMVRWLKPGGVMSHQIELSCEGGEPWNHHWVYGPRTWTVIRGRRPYYKNRVPMSEYVRLFTAAGCSVVATIPVTKPGLPREATAAQFRQLPDEDFQTASVFLIAVKAS